jgi:hypothetical protein
MSVWERQLQYLFERAQEEAGHENSPFRRVMTISAAGSIYTAVVTGSLVEHMHIHALSVYNPGNATAVVRGYHTGSNATSQSNTVFTIAVPAAVDSKMDVAAGGISLPDGEALLVGLTGGQAGQLVEIILYGHYDTD